MYNSENSKHEHHGNASPQIDNKISFIKSQINEINFTHVEPNRTNFEKEYVLFDRPEVHYFEVKRNTKTVFITMVAGGGAGGIGFVDNMYYYAGGGGGAGSCFIKKPIDVVAGTILKITVGKGGSQSNNTNGQDTTVEIINDPEAVTTSDNIVLKTYGGQNGNPQYNSNTNSFNKITTGGSGGKSELASFLTGDDGKNGNVSVPSQISALAGDGAASAFSSGGKAGGTYVLDGNLVSHIIGESGHYGSGGGGSSPRIKINFNERLSGNGGDGMVLVEW